VIHYFVLAQSLMSHFERYPSIYPIVKLLLSFAKIINLIQYLLGGTVFLL